MAGFLLPDYVDGAVEVFDGTGKSLGQLRKTARGGEWEPAPGREGLASERLSPKLPNAALERVVHGLLRELFVWSQGGQGPHPLDVFLAYLDRMQATVARGVGGEKHLALLLGAPVAVVRAKLGMSLNPTPEQVVVTELTKLGATPTQLAGLPAGTPSTLSWPGGLKVRLGATELLDDGLLGYYAEGQGKLQTSLAGSVQLSHAGLGVNARLSQLDLLQADARLELSPGSSGYLTLLMVPGASVHVSAGVVPQKRVQLLTQWVDDGLENLMPSFRFGPLLVDPAQLRLPMPGLDQHGWEWVTRTQPAAGEKGWSAEDVGTLPDTAIMPMAPVVAQEGWLRLEKRSS